MDSEQEAVPAAEPKLRDLHVMICVPMHGAAPSGFVWSLFNLGLYFASMPYDGDKKIGLEICKSSNLVEGRTRLVSRAMNQGATHVLFLDSDMKVKADIIPRLLNHGKHIVAVNYPTKEAHPRPTSYCDSDDYVGPLWTKPESEGLVEVAHAGFGAMLIDMKVFDVLDLPYFQFEPMAPDFVKTKAEDVYFCAKARNAGFQIWVDHEASKDVAHIGDFEYTNFFANEAETVHQALYRDLPG